MAFTTTISKRERLGRTRIVIGYASESATTGDIVTGLARIDAAFIQEATSQSASPSIDVTTTAGTITLDKLVGSGNVYFVAYGN